MYVKNGDPQQVSNSSVGKPREMVVEVDPDTTTCALSTRCSSFELFDLKFIIFYIYESMKEENVIVHSIWVGDSLSLLEQLTIKLLQHHGHIVHLWCYNSVANVPSGTVIRDASDILPKNSIFSFQGETLPYIPNGGKGSLSHWSDQFQVKLLNIEGGIYTQLDVAYLHPLDFTQQYMFVSHVPRSLSTFLMKCPKGSPFTIEAYKELSMKINQLTIPYHHWDCSMNLLMDVLVNNTNVTTKICPECFLNKQHYLDLGCKRDGPFFQPFAAPDELIAIHWSNATVNVYKNHPLPNSFYEYLLKFVNLI